MRVCFRKTMLAAAAVFVMFLMGSTICQAADSYQLSIMGTRIVEDGKVVGTCPEGFSYDPATKTVTLDSVNVTLSGQEDEWGYVGVTVIEAEASDIRIVLQGSNTIVCPKGVSGSFFSNFYSENQSYRYNAVTVSGPGSLNIINNDYFSLGRGGEITLSNCTVDYQFPQGDYIALCLEAVGDLHILNSTLRCEADYHEGNSDFGFIETEGNLDIQNSNVSVTANVQTGNLVAINCWEDANIVNSNISLKAPGKKFYTGIKVVEDSYKPSEGKAVCTIQNSTIEVINAECGILARKFNIVGDYQYYLDNQLTSEKDFFSSYSGYLTSKINADVRLVPGKAPASGNGSTAKKNQSFSYTKTYTKTYGAKAFNLKVKRNAGDGKLTYKSSNSKVAAVNDKGKVTVKGTGICTVTINAAETSAYNSESLTVTIKVKPKKASMKKVSAGKGQLKASWKRDTRADGYQLQYSTDKKFTKKAAKAVTVKKNKSLSKTVKKLKKGKRYYVRVRAYKKGSISGKSETLYGAWSTAKLSGKIK